MWIIFTMFAGNKTKFNIMFTQTTKVQRLQKRSSDALGVFKKTISDLALINQEIEKEVAINDSKIAELLEENGVYEQGHAENSAFIYKINEFLGLQ